MATQLPKTGIVGPGFIGGAHVEALRRLALADVVAVAASTPRSAGSAAERWGVPVAHPSWRALVDDPEIDVVHVCTPPSLHVEIALAALDRGKHVVVEKPLADSSAAALRLAAAAAGSHSVAAVCLNYRHFAMVEEARRLLASGALGRPFFVHGRYLQEWLCEPGITDWRLDGDQAGPSLAFGDVGIHWCDLAAHLVGEPVSAVAATLGSAHTLRDDHGAVLLELGDGIRGAATVSQVSAGAGNALSIQVDATGGSVAWDQEQPDLLRVVRAGETELVRRDGDRPDGHGGAFARLPAGHVEGWSASIENFMTLVYAAVRTPGGPPPAEGPFATVADGVALARLVEAVVESDERRAWVALPAADG